MWHISDQKFLQNKRKSFFAFNHNSLKFSVPCGQQRGEWPYLIKTIHLSNAAMCVILSYMVGKVPRFLYTARPALLDHCRPFTMFSLLNTATSTVTSTVTHLLSCRVQTSQSTCDNLHPGALCSAKASTFRFLLSPTMSLNLWDSNLSFNFGNGLCLVIAWAIPHVLWAAWRGGGGPV